MRKQVLSIAQVWQKWINGSGLPRGMVSPISCYWNTRLSSWALPDAFLLGAGEQGAKPANLLNIQSAIVLCWGMVWLTGKKRKKTQCAQCVRLPLGHFPADQAGMMGSNQDPYKKRLWFVTEVLKAKWWSLSAAQTSPQSVPRFGF